MQRWVLVLLVIGGAVWFWRRDAGAATVTEESLASVTTVPEAEEVTSTPAVLSAPLRDAATPADPIATVCAAIRAGDAAAVANGYRTLLDAPAEKRAAVAEALAAAAGDQPATMLAALGDGNAFLHSEAGRASARRLVEVATKRPAEECLRLLTGLLERAMRGSIERSDHEAIALVDDAYAAMQGPLNRTLFNPEYLAGARTHQVAAGESLDRIAAHYRKHQGIKVDAMTLGLFNRISDPTKLRRGQILKIPVQPISTVLEKRSYLMAMYCGGVIFRLYWVGHGKEDRTPETTFTIGLKQERPDWHIDGRVIPYGHPDNILGDYFVKFEHHSFQGYGAHGTPEPQTIGTMASRGCIRMRDEDIRDFFAIVPRGTQVHVRATQGPGER